MALDCPRFFVSSVRLLSAKNEEYPEKSQQDRAIAEVAAQLPSYLSPFTRPLDSSWRKGIARKTTILRNLDTETLEKNMGKSATGSKRCTLTASDSIWRLKLLGRLLATLIFGLGVLWAAGALYFDLPVRPILRNVAAVVWFVGAFTAWFWLPRRHWSRSIVGIVFLCILGWWLGIPPLQNRDWNPDVAVLGNAVIDGEKVTINNVRNFDWRSLTDCTPRYETRTYNLSRLLGADLFVIYWGSPLIAHTIASFDFGDQGRICFSIETRPERGKAYSAIGGLYRQFELIYVAVDERDAIRVRTNFRKDEEAYLYHLNLPLEEVRARFLEYLKRMNQLYARPEWYNALTSNCTTNIRTQHTVAKPAPWDWRILVNGKGDELLYERGVLDRSIPFTDLKRRAHINGRAHAADNALDFSERIRSETASDKNQASL